MKRSIIAFLVALTGITYSSAEDPAFLFSYFTGESDGLHLAYSYDGLNWTAINDNKSLLVPTVGEDKLMRDPSICQGPDGTFHMVWTSSWNDQIIGYSSSKDLINWTEQRAIPVMTHEPETLNCWAPELYYNAPDSTFHIFWASTIPGRHSYVPTSERERQWNHRIYEVTTRDFETFTPARLWFNPDFSVIDAAIVKMPDSEDLMMVLKNENSNPPEKNLRVTRTDDINKGFPTSVSDKITGEEWVEGPSPLFVGDTLYIYFDMYRSHRYGAVMSTDGGRTFTDISDKVSFPKGIRHGTAFPVKKEVVETLLSHYGQSGSTL